MYGQPPLIIITAKWTKLLGVIVNSKHTRLIKVMSSCLDHSGLYKMAKSFRLRSPPP